MAKFKNLVEIQTKGHSWITVELIEHKGSIIVIKMPDGQVINRKSSKMRGVVKRIKRTIDGTKQDSYTKSFRTKKKRNRRNRKIPNKRINYEKLNKWKDVQAPTLEGR